MSDEEQKVEEEVEKDEEKVETSEEKTTDSEEEKSEESSEEEAEPEKKDEKPPEKEKAKASESTGDDEDLVEIAKNIIKKHSTKEGKLNVESLLRSAAHAERKIGKDGATVKQLQTQMESWRSLIAEEPELKDVVERVLVKKGYLKGQVKQGLTPTKQEVAEEKAPTEEELNKEVGALLAKGKYTEAMKLANKYAPELKEIKGRLGEIDSVKAKIEEEKRNAATMQESEAFYNKHKDDGMFGKDGKVADDEWFNALQAELRKAPSMSLEDAHVLAMYRLGRNGKSAAVDKTKKDASAVPGKGKASASRATTPKQGVDALSDPDAVEALFAKDKG